MTVQQIRGDAVKAWKSTMIAGGIATIILGLVLLIWPKQTLLVFASLLGIGLILIGIARIASAAADKQTRGRSRVWRAVLGLIYVIAGIVVLANLYGTLRFLVWAVGIIWVITGLFEIFSALARGGRAATPAGRAMDSSALARGGRAATPAGRAMDSESDRPQGERGVSIVIGLLNLAFGIVLLVWPGPTVVILVWISGLWLIALGLLQIVFAFMAGRMMKGDGDNPAYHVVDELR